MALLAAAFATAEPTISLPQHEILHYGVEWRLIPAGFAKLTIDRNPPAANQGWTTKLDLESTGLVSKLYKISDQYRANYESNFCATDSMLQASRSSARRGAISRPAC